MRRPAQPIRLLLAFILAGWCVCRLDSAEPAGDEVQALSRQFAKLYAQGQFEESVPVLDRLLEIQKAAHGAEHPKTAAVLNNLAIVHRQLGDFELAETLAMRALNIYGQAYGTNHAEFATVLFNVGGLFQVTENYAKAETLYRQTLQILEAPPATNFLRRAGAWVNLGGVRLSQGDYAQAESCLLRAQRLYEETGLTNHADLAECLNNLANLYQRLKDFPKAERLYERCLQLRQAVSGPDHRDVAASLANLGALYWAMQDNEKAEARLVRALQIYEKAVGENHPRTAGCLQNLAVVCRGMGKHAQAEALYQHALAVIAKTSGTNHYRYAAGLNNLAVLYRNMGDSRKALSFCERALAILDQTVGLDSSRAIPALKTYVYLKADLGELEGVPAAWKRVRAGEEKETSRILAFTSERQRLQFQSRHNFSELLNHVGSGPDAAEIVLRNKAIVLDSLMEDQQLARASANPEVKATIDQLRSAGRRLQRLSESRNSTNAPGQTRPAALQSLDDEMARLQKDLARQVAGAGRARRALGVTLPQVQAAMSPPSVLLEWVVYRHYLRTGDWESRYGVVVIPSSQRALPGRPAGEPAWVPIASAKEIEGNIRRYLAAVRGAGDERILRILHRQLFEPIAPLLPAGTDRLLVCPDGELNFLSFATLLGADDRFLAESYLIHYVSSGRDLLWQPTAAPKPQMLVFANPEFEAAPTSEARPEPGLAMLALDRRDYRTLPLAPLPGTLKEAEFLSRMTTSWKLPCSVRAGRRATEAELSAAASPRILHLGTHGFFLPEPEPDRALEAGAAEALHNPMHRSGLALAGAQPTFAAWARGEVPPPSQDGVVTAQEIAGLDLAGTWLVVLSACDSGSGEARAGEGVLGLRRGLMLAGAQNVLMSLAPISDRTTAGLLEDFYRRAMSSGNAAQAFAQTQREWLSRLRKQQGALEAMRTAGPFVLAFQGADAPARRP